MALSSVQNPKNPRWREISSSLTFTELVLLASYALSNGNEIQIYGDKFLFHNIFLAGSKGFGGTFSCLKYQKFLATARFPNQNKHFLENNWCPQSPNIQRCFTII